MKRRTFVIRGSNILLTVPVGWAIAGCSGTSYSTPSTNVTTSGLRFTSSVVGGHSHDFTINMQDLATPPAAGISGDTTTAAGHMHTVSLSQADLTQIQANQVVTKDTSVTGGHIHTFSLLTADGRTNDGGTGSGGSSGGSGAGGGGTAGSVATTGGSAGIPGYPRTY